MTFTTRLSAAVLCGALAAASVPATASAHPARGELLDVVPVSTMDTDQLVAHLGDHDLDASRVRFAVEAKRITYRTVDAFGKPTTASALVALPRDGGRTPRQAAWLHGTTGYRGSVASVADGNDRAATYLFASAGYLTTAPDYLGLGTGPGFHPYVDAPSTVTASVDALRATRSYAASRGLRPDRRVMITGHSQGGHAAMALGQALQRGADSRLEVGALAPIGGPFKPSLLVAKALNDEIANGVAYMAYWTVAWNRLFPLYDSPAEVFRDPSVEALFDGEHPNEEIFRHLPATMRELLTDSYSARLRHPTGTLRTKLREADGYCDWRPSVPVTIYSSAGDRDTLLETSAYCDQQLKKHHARSTLVDLGADVNHGRAAKLALPRILADFDGA
ncbi:alpha/beta hydrolase family protein [Lentzea jiangxiensis]|uniref:Acetyl esterase/lipase n=1 Tax=Lentzea jiangxiensis TaxID=641025 RepID=A0A1H0H131_9PSEU|nr:lipase family protein [Lentzea jiangxiensis]SDO12815.1 Acetyl esterase/lipase [Lentzea jiangxiensis]